VCALQRRICTAHASCNTKSGWRKPAVANQPQLHRRSSTHRRQSLATLRNRSCKCASRSPRRDSRPPLLCTCVWASQKSFFRRQTFTPQHKSGGVSPPWLDERNCTGVRQRTAGGLPNNCGGACGSASPESTAGLRPPLLTLRATTVSEYARNRAGHAVPEARRVYARRSRRRRTPLQLRYSRPRRAYARRS